MQSPQIYAPHICPSDEALHGEHHGQHSEPVEICERVWPRKKKDRTKNDLVFLGYIYIQVKKK